MSTLHYYIPKNADNLFFEVGEEDVAAMSQLPLEKFHRQTMNKYKKFMEVEHPIQ